MSELLYRVPTIWGLSHAPSAAELGFKYMPVPVACKLGMWLNVLVLHDIDSVKYLMLQWNHTTQFVRLISHDFGLSNFPKCHNLPWMLDDILLTYIHPEVLLLPMMWGYDE